MSTYPTIQTKRFTIFDVTRHSDGNKVFHARGRWLLLRASKPNAKPNAILLGSAKGIESAKAFVWGPPNGLRVRYVLRPQKIFFREHETETRDPELQ